MIAEWVLILILRTGVGIVQMDNREGCFTAVRVWLSMESDAWCLNTLTGETSRRVQ